MPKKLEELGTESSDEDESVDYDSESTEEEEIIVKKISIEPIEVLESVFDKTLSQKLNKIKYDDDEKFFNFDSLEGIGNMVEILAMKDNSTKNEMYKAIKSAVKSDEKWLLEQNNPYYNFVSEEVKTLQKLEIQVSARKDLGECRQCGCDEIIVTSKQMTCGDEGTTTIRRCAKCNSRSVKLFKRVFN